MRRKTHILGLVAILSLPVLAADNVHLSIDGVKPGPKIDRNIFGQFAENLGHALYEGIWLARTLPSPTPAGSATMSSPYSGN